MTTANHTRNGSTYIKPSTRLRQLLAQPGCIQAPGVYDGISARLAIEAGFPCMVCCSSSFADFAIVDSDAEISTNPAP